MIAQPIKTVCALAPRGWAWGVSGVCAWAWGVSGVLSVVCDNDL